MGFLHEFREIEFFILAFTLLASAAFYYDIVLSVSGQALSRLPSAGDLGASFLLAALLFAIVILGCGFSFRSAIISRKPARLQVWLMFLGALVTLISLSIISLPHLAIGALGSMDMLSAALLVIPIVTLVRIWALISGFVSRDSPGMFDFEGNASAIQAIPSVVIVILIGAAVRMVLPEQLPLAALAVYQCASYASSMMMIERPMRKNAKKAKKRRR